MGWNCCNTFSVDINEDLVKETVDIIIKRGMKRQDTNILLLMMAGKQCN
jgi:transposase